MLGALVVAALFLSACSASGESNPDSAPSGPVPTASTIEPVVRDDGADLPSATFATDPVLGDVIGQADSGLDLRSAEQFALSAMQFLLDSDNSGLEASDLDEIVSDDVKRFILHANEGVEDLDVDQEFLVDEAGWVRSQWIDEAKGSARSQFLVRHRYEMGAVQTKYWADVRVDLQRVDDRWTVAKFMFAPGPREKEMDEELKEIYMQDESTWRPISALK